MNNPGFEVFERRFDSDHQNPGTLSGRYGWRFRDEMGKIIATIDESFATREDAHRAVRVLCATVVSVSTAGIVAAADVPIADVEVE